MQPYPGYAYPPPYPGVPAAPAYPPPPASYGGYPVAPYGGAPAGVVAAMPQAPSAPRPLPVSTAPVGSKEARTCYVTGIDQSLNEAALKEFFLKHGSVNACRLAGDTNHPTRFGFVEFTTAEEAGKVVAQSQKLFLMERPIKVIFSKAAIQQPVAGAPGAGAVVPGGSGGPGGAVGAAGAAAGMTEQHRCTVYVTGVQNFLSDEQVKRHFEELVGMLIFSFIFVACGVVWCGVLVAQLSIVTPLHTHTHTHTHRSCQASASVRRRKPPDPLFVHRVSQR